MPPIAPIVWVWCMSLALVHISHLSKWWIYVCVCVFRVYVGRSLLEIYLSQHNGVRSMLARFVHRSVLFCIILIVDIDFFYYEYVESSVCIVYFIINKVYGY